jgi:hypothetical protein
LNPVDVQSRKVLVADQTASRLVAASRRPSRPLTRDEKQTAAATLRPAPAGR